MNNEDFINLLQPILNEIEIDDNILSSYLYSFKSKLPININPYLVLDYEFYTTKIEKKQVTSSVKSILSYFIKYKLSNNKFSIENYNLNNPKSVIDFIKLNNLDFTEPEILQGTKDNLDSNSYKIEYLLYSMNANCKEAINTNDYKGLKHSALQLITYNKNVITIINKTSPIYRVKGLLYQFNTDDNEILGLEKVKENFFFKLPSYPHVIIINDQCFLIQDNVESIFGFEEYNKLVCKEQYNNIKNSINLVDNGITLVNEFISKGKNYNLFADFNTERLNSIKNNDSRTIAILRNELHIPTNNQGELTITTPEQAQQFVYFLCGYIKKDIYTNHNEIAKKAIPL